MLKVAQLHRHFDLSFRIRSFAAFLGDLGSHSGVPFRAKSHVCRIFFPEAPFLLGRSVEDGLIFRTSLQPRANMTTVDHPFPKTLHTKPTWI